MIALHRVISLIARLLFSKHLNGDTQTVLTNINLDGNVKIEENINGVAFSDITAKYEYNSGSQGEDQV